MDVPWGGPTRVMMHHDADPRCPLVCFAQVVARDPFLLVGRRFSIGMSVHPNYDQRIECLPSCLSAGETPRDPPITAGEHIKRKIERSHETA